MNRVCVSYNEVIILSIMKEEILSTPDLLEQAMPVYLPVVKALADKIREKNCKSIYTASRGTSNNAALYFQYLCDVLTTLSCKNLQPSVVTLMGGKPDLRDGIYMAISQGGRGADIRMMTEYAASCGICTAAVTNEEDSPLAQMSDIVLPLSMQLERSMAATKTFSAQLMALGMLAYTLAGRQPEELSCVSELFRQSLLCTEDAIKNLDHYTASRSCFVLARGALLPVAKELCCKLQETCLINATPYSAADFLHGPFSLIEPGVQVILFHRNDETAACTSDMYDRLVACGAEVTVFTDCPDFASGKDRAIVLPNADWTIAPFCFTAAAQLFAAHLADLRGTNPDTSRNLLKYTITV